MVVLVEHDHEHVELENGMENGLRSLAEGGRLVVLEAGRSLAVVGSPAEVEGLCSLAVEGKESAVVAVHSLVEEDIAVDLEDMVVAGYIGLGHHRSNLEKTCCLILS